MCRQFYQQLIEMAPKITFKLSLYCQNGNLTTCTSLWVLFVFIAFYAITWENINSNGLEGCSLVDVFIAFDAITWENNNSNGLEGCSLVE